MLCTNQTMTATAFRLLQRPSPSASCEWNWSLFGNVHNKLCNRLTSKCKSNLTVEAAATDSNESVSSESDSDTEWPPSQLSDCQSIVEYNKALIQLSLHSLCKCHMYLRIIIIIAGIVNISYYFWSFTRVPIVLRISKISWKETKPGKKKLVFLPHNIFRKFCIPSWNLP